MPTYRYYTTDILTGAVMAELPLYGVYLDKGINSPGNFNGTFRLNTKRYSDASLLGGTTSGKMAIYVERNDTLIWGGILWSRTYDSTSQTIQLSGQTWESVFDHTVFRSHIIQQDIEQGALFKNLIDTLQAQAQNNFGFIMDVFPDTGVKRTVLLPSYDFPFVIEGVSALSDVDNGLEYTVDILPTVGTPDTPRKKIRVGFPKLGSLVSVSGNVYDYPGTIQNYWWPENAAQGATRVAALGAGDGNKVLRAVSNDLGKLNGGWPSWWQVNKYANLGTQKQVTARAIRDLKKKRIPVTVPTFELAQGALFSSWNNVGDYFRVTIQDPRFPTGKSVTERMVGWSLSAQTDDTEEILKFAIEGDDAG